MDSPPQLHAMLPGLKRRRVDIPLCATPSLLPSLSHMLKHRKGDPCAETRNPNENDGDNGRCAWYALRLLGTAAEMHRTSSAMTPRPAHQRGVTPDVWSTRQVQSAQQLQQDVPSSTSALHLMHALPLCIDSRIPRLRAMSPLIKSTRNRVELSREQRVARWRQKRLRQTTLPTTDHATSILDVDKKKTRAAGIRRQRVQGRFARTSMFVPITAFQS
ncbi:hypothetical protein DYB38_002468 [Aphanomyces astaci]|uniref:CCT domain-containing protein n=1 Tax=Aphanomyces astaci TaxID=112090 RepID=A0A397DWC5_APHAT|nr:hypothetical protein DYB34_001721 [Aphanomyces astaci]RHY69366.1 hypothetical protein DYB38_002468 [Aphanomyces astaci]